MTPYLRIGLFALLFALTANCSPGLCNEPADTAAEELNTDDGPHVYWQDDTTAIAFYYCNGAIESRSFAAQDTVRFTGFCKDSSQTYIVPVAPPTQPPADIQSVSKVLAMSDIHGDYEHFTEILINAGVIDSNLHWTWGDGHLIITGDVFDRGEAVTECLWLIYALEHEAPQSGGAVHFLLGNHDVMVMQGDLRYVHERYMTGIGRRFNYPDLFRADMELGRWLRTKPAVVRINRSLYVHGGISPEFAAPHISIDYLNQLTRQLVAMSSVESYLDDTAKALYGSLGPFWYRGYHYAMEDRYPEITQEKLADILNHFDVDCIVVGHSQHDNLETLKDGKVVAIDVRVDKLDGQQALLIQAGKLYVVHADGTRVVQR